MVGGVEIYVSIYKKPVSIFQLPYIFAAPETGYAQRVDHRTMNYRGVLWTLALQQRVCPLFGMPYGGVWLHRPGSWRRGGRRRSYLHRGCLVILACLARLF